MSLRVMVVDALPPLSRPHLCDIDPAFPEGSQGGKAGKGRKSEAEQGPGPGRTNARAEHEPLIALCTHDRMSSALSLAVLSSCVPCLPCPLAFHRPSTGAICRR